MSKYIAENDLLGFVQYTHDDDVDMLICWQDHDTQKGYNYAFDGALDDLSNIDIAAFPFWVVAIDKPSGEKIGVLRLSSGDDQDLAIWIYPNYRGKGYGKEAFTLAVNHIFHSMNLQRIYAGCYCDNEASLKILQKSGFIRYPEGDQNEINCFTGKPITQLSFVRTIDNGMNDISNALSKAWEMFDRGDFQGAEDLYLTCYEQIRPSDHENINIALMGLLYAEAFLEKYEEARKYGNILLHEAQDEEEKHIAIHQIGMVERMAGNYERAMELFMEEAHLISFSFPDDTLRMSANFYEQGYIALKMKDYAQAEKLMLMSLECAIKAKDEMCMGCAFRGMGELMEAVGNRASAIGYFRKAIAAFTTAGDWVAVEEMKSAIQQIEA